MKTIFDTNDSYKIPAKIDCSIYSLIGQDGVIDDGNSGGNFALNNTGLSCTFLLDSIASIGGSFFHIDSTHNFTLPNNLSMSYLCLRINPLTSPKASIVYLTQAQIQQGNLYKGEIRDLPLYQLSTNSSGITYQRDVRVIRSARGGAISGYNLWSGTQAEYNALTKDNNTLYFIKE